ncbi:hypothetical protein RUM43_010380 [Polyplax serrata]|uniref:TauD/TfdA-like domain-containing protein n=1 Tax=Polyplax serrata TaxID=468196 RepID=A0AAN8S0F4_POLSC
MVKLNFSQLRPRRGRGATRPISSVGQDGHKSVYSVSFLENVSYENYLKRLQRNYILWTKDEIFNLPVSHVPFEDLLGTEEGVLKTVKSLVDYGIAFVENVPADIKATEEAVVKLSHVQHTLFGGMWEFSDSMDHQDTAYTTGELGLHTDNTYFTEAAGLQVLHCLNHTGTGGMNMLVDGFKAAEILRASNPDAFSRLATTCLEAEYLEPGYHHTYTAPGIKLHPVTKQLEQIR